MKISVLTLGCKVNQYESGAIAKHLLELGHETTETLSPADIYIINTCAVTNDAEKKSRQLITKCLKQNKDGKIIVMGCATQNKTENFQTKHNVLYMIGNAKKEMAISEVEKIQREQIEKSNAKSAEKVEETFSLPKHYEEEFASSTHKTRAFIKVQDGCNNFCSYCIIPYLRGRSRSRSLQSVSSEISQLQDVHEVVLVGIDLSDYESGLENLALETNKHGVRFRFGSLEASVITEKLLSALKSCENFCPQFHLSLQAGDDETLFAMNRKYTTAEYFEKVQLIREHFENSSITTDIIVGFPTETKSQFEISMQFAKKVEFADIHVFPYSVRSGTLASKKYQDMPAEFKNERKDKMLEVKSQLIHNYLNAHIGKTVEVLLEEQHGEYFVGHSREFIKCYIKGVKSNQIVKVVVEKAYKDGVICTVQ
ncbi:MAG: tRNA (N(6)-L-threonylcarbamoyladenosine(37)-C(2))-methylthiotransferase MtaB [Bacillota bacterium]